MNGYIQHFVDLYPPHSYWSIWTIYPEEAKGFSQEELQTFAEKLDICLFDELAEFLSNFGKCGAGIFNKSFFWFYSDNFDDYIKRNSYWIDDMIEEDFFDKNFRDKKPLFFGDYENCVFYFICTNSTDTSVWEYNESEDILTNTHQSFFEFLEKYVIRKKYLLVQPFISATKEEVLKYSRCLFFDE